jgi:F subunit of K+-transporting ATPase (Potass_KdpF)
MSPVLATMSGADVFGLIVSVLVIVYLLYALVRGEKL